MALRGDGAQEPVIHDSESDEYAVSAALTQSHESVVWTLPRDTSTDDGVVVLSLKTSTAPSMMTIS